MVRSPGGFNHALFRTVQNNDTEYVGSCDGMYMCEWVFTVAVLEEADREARGGGG